MPSKRQPKGSPQGGQYAPSPAPDEQSVTEALELERSVPSPSADTEIIARANRPIPFWSPQSLERFQTLAKKHREQGGTTLDAHREATGWLYKHGVSIDEAPMTDTKREWLDAEKAAVDASREFSDKLGRSFASGLCRADTPEINEARQTTMGAAEQAQRLRETYFATI